LEVQDPNLLARVRAWTYSRQRLGKTANAPLAALEDVVAVYSSHPTARLALLSRADLGPHDLAHLEESRQVLRIPALRQSIFLVPAEIAERLFTAMRLPMQRHAWRLQYAGLSWDDYAAFKQRALARLQEPVAASDLQDIADGDQRVMTGIRAMTYEGLVLRLGTTLRSDRLRYVATEAWLGRSLAPPADDAAQEEALRWLAGAYLHGYGPARTEDFAWWTGVPPRNAARALKAVKTVDVGGGLLLPAGHADDFARVPPLDPDAIDVLPKWDAYTMGLAPDGRQRFIDPEHLRLAYSDGSTSATSGDGHPLVLRGGRAVARWAHRFKGKKLLVEVTPFEAGPLPPRLHSAFDGVGALLGASAIEVQVLPLP
jgi:hypothetical protein